jgi:VanZ family protein
VAPDPLAGTTARRVARGLSLWAPVAAQLLLIFALSSASQLPAPPGRLSDKQAHAIAYAVLALLLCRALAGGRLSGLTAGRVVVAALLTVAYGATDEWHQSFVPGRQSDVADLYADAMGAALAAAACFSCGIIGRFRRGGPRAAR